MKMIIMIISSLFFFSLSDTQEYNLAPGIPMNITDSKKGDILYFLFKSSEYNKLTISFTMNNIYKNSISYIELKEASSFESYGIDIWGNRTILTKEINSDLIISASYKVNSLKYIFFRIRLECDIKDFIVKINEVVGAYELNNDIKKINYLLPDDYYYFYRKACPDLKVDFNFAMDYLSTDSIKNIYIYEYQEWGEIMKKSTKQPIITRKEGIKLIISFSYTVSLSYAKFVAIFVQPSQEIHNIEVKMDLLAEFYELENRKSITVHNLISDIIYIFFINAKMYTEAEFIINMDKRNESIAFNNTGIFRYRRSDNLFNEYLRYEPYNYNMTQKGNELEFSLHYSINYYQIEKIALKLQSLSEIDYINIKANIEGGLYELIDGSVNINNLIPDTSYYFYTDTLLNHNSNISFEIKSSKLTPFSFANIYESSKIDDISGLKTASVPISPRQIDDMLFTSFTYTNSKDYCKYIFVEIRPSSIIDSLTAKIIKNVEFYNLTINSQKTFYNLTFEKFHYFNMKIEEYSKVTINITLDTEDDNPFNLSNLYYYNNEIPSFSEFIKCKYKKQIHKIENKTIISITYKSQYYSNNYISYAIKPLYNIDEMNINTFQEKQSYEIIDIDIFTQNITNLFADNSYYFFYTKNRRLLYFDLYIAMNYTEEMPFTILSLQNGNMFHNLNVERIIKQFNNEWVLKYSFNIPEQIFSEFLYFYITPKIDIDYLFTRIDIYYNKILLDTDSEKKNINFKSGEKYYLNCKVQSNKTIFVNIEMDIIYNNSFSFVNIYEYNDLINAYYNKKTTIKIKENIKGNKIEISFSYKIVNISTNYTFIEIFPKKDIKKMIIDLNVTNITNDSEGSNNKKSKKFKAYYIIVPLIIIVFIIIIIFVIIWAKKKTKQSSESIENTNIEQPLFSSPEN